MLAFPFCQWKRKASVAASLRFKLIYIYSGSCHQRVEFPSLLPKRGKDLSRDIIGFVVIVSRTIDLQSETRMFVAETTFVRKFVVEKHVCSFTLSGKHTCHIGGRCHPTVLVVINTP